MTRQDPPDFEYVRVLLHNAQLHFKLVFGLTATRPEVRYLDGFTFGTHTATREELVLTAVQEEQAFAALEHCGTYLAVVQAREAFNSIYERPFSIPEPEVSSAFHIARLIRNAFAHNPFSPVWKIDKRCRDKAYSVPHVISLNTSGLHGQPVRREHYGGPLAILRFLQYVDNLVQVRSGRAET